MPKMLGKETGLISIVPDIGIGEPVKAVTMHLIAIRLHLIAKNEDDGTGVSGTSQQWRELYQEKTGATLTAEGFLCGCKELKASGLCEVTGDLEYVPRKRVANPEEAKPEAPAKKRGK